MSHDPVVVEVEARELAVGSLQVELDIAVCAGCAAADFGELVFEA
jgi:hypothetical protein